MKTPFYKRSLTRSNDEEIETTSDEHPRRTCKYTKDHEWAKVDGKRVTVGITAFAVEQLGDITLVNLDVKVGDELTAGKAFGTIESVKTLSDLFAPVSGKVVEINKDARRASPSSSTRTATARRG